MTIFCKRKKKKTEKEMNGGDDDDEIEVEPAEQQVRWKIEALLIRAMKSSTTMQYEALVASALAGWQALGRPEPMSRQFVEERIAFLVRREWFVVRDGTVTLLDLSQQDK